MAQLELIKRLATSTGSSKQLVAAVTGKKIRVLSMVLNRHGGTTVTVSIRTNNGSGTRILYDVESQTIPALSCLSLTKVGSRLLLVKLSISSRLRQPTERSR